MSEAGRRRLHVEALPEIGSLSEVTTGIIEFMGIVTGPIRRGDGITPAVALVDPKFPHNVYVFGPEDGSLGRATLAQCHRFVVIPTRHGVNLSAAVYTVLYDRHAKRVHDGLELPHSTAGDFDEPDHMANAVGVSWGG
jgi:hypothetical protein